MKTSDLFRRVLSALACLCAAALSADVPPPALPVWKGDGLRAWTKRVSQCRDVRVENGVLKGVVTGRDSQFYAPVQPHIVPAGNHAVYLTLKTSCGGKGQIFWMRPGDARPSEERQTSFRIIGDGTSRIYRVKMPWPTDKPINCLRLDLPPEMKNNQPFEISEIRVDTAGQAIDVDTSKHIGVAFDLQMPPGRHYCTLTWTSDTIGAGNFGFTTATDGAKHSYWFDLREARRQGWGPNPLCWKGRLTTFAVEQTRYERELPAENLRFITAPPDTPADPVVTSAHPCDAIPRAGRPFTLEVIVRNFGARAASNLVFSLNNLPAGAQVLDTADLRPAAPLPGANGRESIWADCRPPLPQERVFRIRLSDLGAGAKSFNLALAADGVPTRVTRVTADILPSLNLPPAAGPAEPRPVDTAPYKIGAFLFPGWDVHRWHAVWSHAPWRKPALGWYDETKPETLDWQIKHMVENGISFVFVDWYWTRGKHYHDHWEKAFRLAKFRRHLQWSLMWANHNGPGSHSVEDQEKVTRFWIDNLFNDPQYLTIDGMPVVSIWSPDGMERDMKNKGGCKALLEVSQRVARTAGLKGIYFIAVRGPDREDAAFLKSFADKGFSRTCVYKYMGGIAGAPTGEAGSRPFAWLADTSLAHWRALRQNSTIPFLPSLSTAWDDRPWRGETGWEITNINARDFKRICADAKTFSDESGERLLLLGPLDEWGEGSIGYPNAEHGFGMLEAVREVFGRPPFPLNHTPEDIASPCPQVPLTR